MSNKELAKFNEGPLGLTILCDRTEPKVDVIFVSRPRSRMGCALISTPGQANVKVLADLLKSGSWIGRRFEEDMECLLESINLLAKGVVIDRA